MHLAYKNVIVRFLLLLLQCVVSLIFIFLLY